MNRLLSLGRIAAPRAIIRASALTTAAAAAAVRLSTPRSYSASASIISHIQKTPSGWMRYMSTSASEAVKDVDAEESSNGENNTSNEYKPVPYSSYNGISRNTQLAISKVMGFETATKVQHHILSRMPIEKDVMVKAKTGTGKTAAFLIPAIEMLAEEYKQAEASGKRTTGIGCLVISPTRELAKQIAVEASKLTRFHRWNVQTVVGGESIRGQLYGLQRSRPDIVIGTPGRMLDMLKSQPMIEEMIKKTRVLVFDEADVLLQMGFRDEIETIAEACPQEKRTLLVSATIDKRVRDLVPTVFNHGFDLIDCVDKNEVNTHHRVKQDYIVAEYSQHFPIICEILNNHIQKNKDNKRGSKIIVFMPTTKSVEAYTMILRTLLRTGGGMSRDNDRRMNNRNRPRGDYIDVMKLHGKMRQETRSRFSDRFRSSSIRAGNTTILVTTDVSARGVDYPDVSMVLQVGIPTETEAYIHRIGRTGRAGKDGEGVIILSPLEECFISKLGDIPLKPSTLITPERIAELTEELADEETHIAKRFSIAKESIDSMEIQDVFISFCGYYGGHTSLINDPPGKEIIDGCSSFLEPFGVPVPPIPSVLAQSLGLNKKPRSRGGRFEGNRGGYGNNRGGFRDNNRGGFRDNNRFGGSRDNNRGGNRYGDRNNSYGDRNNSYGDRNNSYGDRNNSYVDRNDRSKAKWMKRGSSKNW